MGGRRRGGLPLADRLLLGGRRAGGVKPPRPRIAETIASHRRQQQWGFGSVRFPLTSDKLPTPRRFSRVQKSGLVWSCLDRVLVLPAPIFSHRKNMLIFPWEQRAAEMAFVQVAAGAFQMPAHHVIAPLAGEESGRAESSASGGARDRRSETLEVCGNASPPPPLPPSGNWSLVVLWL